MSSSPTNSKASPGKNDRWGGRKSAMDGQRPEPCPWFAYGFSDGGAAPGGVGGTRPEMCPSAGARLLARLMTPITMRITGKVLLKERYPSRSWSRRNKTPTVTTTAGPIRPRITQRWQLQRTRLLIEIYPSSLGTTLQPVAKHQNAHTNQNQRP